MAERNNNNRFKNNYNNFHNKKKKDNNSYNNRKKNNHNQYRNKKTIEEYEKIYLSNKMKDKSEKAICPICNEPIYIPEEGIMHNVTNKLAHFECILKEIKSNNEEEMEENDKIVYLGSGTFGIIQERKNSKGTKLFVRKRINYENRKVKKVEDDSDPEEEDLFNV
ncbi:hypothetical protein R4M03_07450 [Brachyspira pilosicoli]|uniref:Uncharacterized protein n=4 Tax=Brachyspira pilosicoli TaxID=52584 RepID=D8ID47_BRAP9|nr:hypothetical protein [Brachyspira pilosicoli]ADK31070.1 hypothetical protein BP951000_1080 [Brachyspira pilosicoli 95/1000]AGA67114.1 hypothetical protein BPP43_09660 [Brachyspira pilosicoli P43/6/78]MBW5377732.1 hypothetical protein [Brachyspira pilosicoli]MBW5381889.1 hypothetical protein [Brachyspira pilosicoli]MBW5391597.1 hypothetical protein [Brachyspira pilosicoli]